MKSGWSLAMVTRHDILSYLAVASAQGFSGVMGHTGKILYIDDDRGCRRALARHLEALHYEIDTAAERESALRCLQQAKYDAIVVDYLLPGTTGLEILDDLRRLQPNAVCILTTGQCSPDLIVDALNEHRISYFIPKPWDLGKLDAIVARATSRKIMSAGSNGIEGRLRRRARRGRSSARMWVTLVLLLFTALACLVFAAHQKLVADEAVGADPLDRSLAQLVSRLYAQLPAMRTSADRLPELMIETFPDLVFVVVTDANGVVRYGHTRSALVQMPASTSPQAALAHLAALPDGDQGNVRVASQPIASNTPNAPPLYGQVKVGWSLSQENAKRTRRTLAAAGGMAILALAAFAAASLMGWILRYQKWQNK